MSLKIGVFIDITNHVDSLIKAKKSHRVNYKKYIDFIEAVGPNLIWKKNAYGIYITDEGIGFIQVLTNLGYTPRFHRATDPLERPNRSVEISLDIIDAMSKLDIVVIGSNSLDFIPLIRWLKSKSIRVWQVTPLLHHVEGDLNIDLLTTDVIEHINNLKGD